MVWSGRRLVGLAALGTAAAVLPIVGAAPPAGAADVTINDCTDASLRTAVAAGGVITYGVDCSDLVLASSLVIPAGKNLTIDGNGHTLVLDGNLAFQQTSKLDVVPPVRVWTSDGSVTASVDGQEAKPLGDTGSEASTTLVAPSGD